MGSYQVKDFEWIRGTTPRLVFEFKRVNGGTEEDPTYEAVEFDEARFTLQTGAAKGGDLICRYSITGGEITKTDPSVGRIEWVMLADDTRALIQTARGEAGKNRYEIELRNGADERVYILGNVAGIGGINDDEG
jgi:hypothetical protein